ncbi:hypothetical protein AB0L74_31895 [Streptomyces sp. NPDC052020]|uniref:hypothetical protein n=1 Tax=Streptomyces sp. NPDC052020 TaxID=3155677 RepID=UPI00342AADD6
MQQFTKANVGITKARAAAQTQLDVIKQQAQIAGTADTSTGQFLNAAYAIADRDGAPRGRALLVGQQKAQVTKASAAALNAILAGALKAGTPVTYSVPYHPDYWKSAKNLLAEYIAKARGGRAMRSLTGEQQTEERGAHD